MEQYINIYPKYNGGLKEQQKQLYTNYSRFKKKQISFDNRRQQIQNLPRFYTQLTGKYTLEYNNYTRKIQSFYPLQKTNYNNIGHVILK